MRAARWVLLPVFFTKNPCERACLVLFFGYLLAEGEYATAGF